MTKKYVPETKGKSVLTDKKLASQVFNPRKIYVTNTMAVWLNKHPAKKNDGSAKKLQRESFKLRWFNLTEEERIPYEKQARDYLAKQELMKECINTDALRKQQGGNCSRSHASLAKVCTEQPMSYRTCKNTILFHTHNFRLKATGAIAAP